MGEEKWLREYESPIMIGRERGSPWPKISDDGTLVTRETSIPFTWRRIFQWVGRPRWKRQIHRIQVAEDET